jgi:hypothetical protein
VYNIVLSSGHAVVANGIECITLGHGIEDVDVLRHSYLGTQKVISDLQRCSGWSSGRVVVNRVKRDPETGMVSGIVEAGEPSETLQVALGNQNSSKSKKAVVTESC